MKIIIAGAKAIGSHLAQLLSRNNEDVTVVDEDGERLASLAANYDILTVQSQTCSLATMKDVGVARADLFIAVTPSENQNMQACMMAKALGAKKTVAKVDTKEYTEERFAGFYEKLGVDKIIYPEMLAGRDIANGLKMSWVRQRWDVHNGALVMLGIKLHEESNLIINTPLKNLCGPEDPYHIVAIKRGDETIIPGGNDELRISDMAYFMTTKQHISHIRQLVGKENYADVKNVMIMGGGKITVRTVSELPEYMKPKVIEIDERRCEWLNDQIGDRCLVINGDGRDMSLLSEEGILNTQAFVALTDNSESNILTCLAAKRQGVRKTVAVVEDLDYVEMAESLDIGTIINKKSIAASNIYQMMLDTNVKNVKFLTTINADVAEFVAKEGAVVTKKAVKDLDLPKGMTIGGIVRGGEGMLVSGSTRIQKDDSVVVFMHGLTLKRVEKLF